jgi:hypothetical protein
MTDKLPDRSVRVQTINSEVLGIDVFGQGKLRLDQFKTKLPLKALASDVLDYIDAHGGGTGGDLVNGHDYFTPTSGVTIFNSGTTSLLNPTVSGWKLRGFYVYGTGNGLVKLTFTVGAVSCQFRIRVNSVNQNQWFLLPNPLPVDNGSVLLEVTNDESLIPVVFWATLFGEDI